MYLQDVIDYYSEEMTEKEFESCKDKESSKKVIEKYFNYQKEFEDLATLMKDLSEDTTKYYMLFSEPTDDLLSTQREELLKLKEYNHIFVKYLLTFA